MLCDGFAMCATMVTVQMQSHYGVHDFQIEVITEIVIRTTVTDYSITKDQKNSSDVSNENTK